MKRGRRHRRALAQGIVLGAGDQRLRMDFVADAADVVSGDVIMTSGIDARVSKNFVIGRFEVVEKSGGAYRRIAVRPAVDFSGLEDVLVVVIADASSRRAAAGRR